MRLRIRIGAVMLLVTYLATVLTIIFSCYPLHRHWQIYPDPGSKHFAPGLVHIAVTKGHRCLPNRNSDNRGSSFTCHEHLYRSLSHVCPFARKLVARHMQRTSEADRLLFR